MRVNIENLDYYLETSERLIVGSPKQVGFSTKIAKYVYNKVFYSDEYSVLILTKDLKSKVDMIHKLKQQSKTKDFALDLDGNVLYTKGEKGSGVCVINYADFNFSNITEKYDLIIVDEDDMSDNLYDNMWILFEYSNKTIINTYDLPDSIFYHLECPKITLKSKYSEKYVEKQFGKNLNGINVDRILLGEFTTI